MTEDEEAIVIVVGVVVVSAGGYWLYQHYTSTNVQRHQPEVNRDAERASATIGTAGARAAEIQGAVNQFVTTAIRVGGSIATSVASGGGGGGH